MKGKLHKKVIEMIRLHSIAIAEHHQTQMSNFKSCSLVDEIDIQNRYWRMVLQDYSEYPECKDAYDALMTSSPEEWMRDFADYVIPLILS